MSEQDAWNKITTYLAENKIKKVLEDELQQSHHQNHHQHLSPQETISFHITNHK